MKKSEKKSLRKVLAYSVIALHSFYKAIIEIVWGISAFLFLALLMLSSPLVSGETINTSQYFIQFSRFVADYWGYWFVLMFVYFFWRDKEDLK